MRHLYRSGDFFPHRLTDDLCGGLVRGIDAGAEPDGSKIVH
jgi:hypothetical protein